jgi:hypothetical protein
MLAGPRTTVTGVSPFYRAETDSRLKLNGSSARPRNDWALSKVFCHVYRHFVRSRASGSVLWHESWWSKDLPDKGPCLILKRCGIESGHEETVGR